MKEPFSLLAKLRLSGVRPEQVWVDFAELREPKPGCRTPDYAVVRPSHTRIDLRPLMRMNIVLCCQEWTKAAVAFFERLTEFCYRVVVVCLGRPDLGFVWYAGGRPDTVQAVVGDSFPQRGVMSLDEYFGWGE